MYILALETSTSSAKAILYDPANGEALTASEAYTPEICNEGMTDTERVFLCAARLGRGLAEGKDVSAVSLCATWCSISVCDRDMRPVSPTYNWDYMPPASMCREIRADRGLSDKLYSLTGCMPHVTYQREALRYLGQNGLSLEGKLLPSQGAYNFYRLTGCFMESVCSVSGAGFINIETQDYDEFSLDYCTAKREQFGELCHYTSPRPLSREGARLLGLKPGIPVVPAHADGALNQIGDGAAKKGSMTLSVGTSAAIRLTTDHPTLPNDRSLWCYSGATDYIVGAAVSGACNCVNWFKNGFLRGIFSFDQLESGVNEAFDPPTFMPHLFGERCPGWRDDRLGVFANLRPEHSVSDMYLAVQQGVLFGLFQCYESLTGCMGEPTDIYLSGGILNSQRWTQMAADIFNKEMRVSQNANASSMGAVLLGLHAAGIVNNVANYEFPLLGERRVISPDKKSTDKLKKAYAAYREWYERSRPAD